MLMPSIFGENLFDNWMDFPFSDDFWTGRSPFYSKSAQSVMKTDIRENDGSYELDIDLPGYKKEDITARLENGCLTISATRNENRDEKDEKGNFIRRERYTGSTSRSFYVGDTMREEDIHAKYEDGILKLSVPKQEQRAIENKGLIAIEG